jgi:hypothetical protein
LTTALLVLLAVNTVALIVVTMMYKKAKRASKVRRVEAPNSQYKSPYVMDLDDVDRWEKIDLSRLHEVNREEFEKILTKLRATSIRALTAQERAFLDRMADSHDRVVRDEKAAGARAPRHLPGTS